MTRPDGVGRSRVSRLSSSMRRASHRIPFAWVRPATTWAVTCAKRQDPPSRDAMLCASVRPSWIDNSCRLMRSRSGNARTLSSTTANLCPYATFQVAIRSIEDRTQHRERLGDREVTRFGRRRALLRILVVWAITAIALHAFALVIPGVHVSGWLAAILGAAAIGLLNALVWPLFVRVALPVTVLTLGLGALLLNGVFISLGARVVEGFRVDSIWSGVAVSVGLTLVNTVFTTLLAIDDDDFYERQVLRRLAERAGSAVSDIPGVVFIQIDGLAHDVLQHAIKSG